MKTEKLTPIQIMTLTSAAIFGVDVLIFERIIISISGRDAWISLALGGLLSIIAGCIMYFLATLYQDKDLPQLLLHVGGKFAGRLLLIPVIIFVSLYSGFTLKLFAQSLKMFVLDRTPTYTVVILMVLITAYAVYHGIYTIGEITDFLFPFATITIITIIVLSLSLADTRHLKPVLFENTIQVIKGIIPGSQQFSGIGSILYILCYTQKTKGRFKWYITGIGIPLIVYMGLIIVCIMLFSAPGTISLIYPTLTLSKSIEFPGTFIERLESFTTLLWIGIIFESSVLFTFASVRNFTVLLGLKEDQQKYIVYGHIPLLTIAALAIKTGRETVQAFELLKYLQTFLALIFIPLITVLALIKRKKEQKR